MKLIIVVFFLVLVLSSNYFLYAQPNSILFGSELELNQVISGKKNKGNPISWINVNTNPDTWKKNKDLLICAGKPIGGYAI